MIVYYVNYNCLRKQLALVCITQVLNRLIVTLKAHFESKPVNILTHGYTLHQRNQGPDESIAEYVAELRRLASHSEFGTFLEQALRDRLVFGLTSVWFEKRVDKKALTHGERAYA